MKLSRFLRRSAAATALVTATWVAGCTPVRPNPQTASPSEFPVYSSDDAILFDDSAAPEVFGLTIGAASSRRMLEGRVRRADSVLHVKIATVTRDADAITLAMRPLGEPLVGYPEEGLVELYIHSDNPTYPLVSNAGESLLGRTVILLFRRYNDRGSIVIHWRVEADTNEIREEVLHAGALRDVAGH